MKRTAGTMLLLAALGGCMTMDKQSAVGAAPADGSAGGQCVRGQCANGSCCRAPVMIPGMQGPYGQPVAMAAPYSAAPPAGTEAARAMLSRSVPLDIIQQTNFNANGGSGIIPAQALAPPGAATPPAGISPPGVPAMPGMPPGGAAGPGGPGGPMVAFGPPPPGVVAGVGALTGHGPNRFASQRTEVRFISPSNMKISWYAPSADGKSAFTTSAIEVPGRYNFSQAAIYRLKLSDIPNRPGLDLYPTLEVVPVNNKTATFLAHSAVPVAFTEDDFEQVASGNYVVKVIYLPDPQFQDLASVGADVVVSSQLEPGVDPIAEACKRGSILLVIRLGNIDLELPNTPPMDAPSPFQHPQPAMPPQMGGLGMMGPGQAGPGPMVPYGMAGPGRTFPNPYAPRSPAGPAAPQPPNGPMGPSGFKVTPNGPVGPNGPLGGGMPPSQLPPGQSLPPGFGSPIPPQQPSGQGTPVSKLPDTRPVQQAQYSGWMSNTPTPAEMAGQGQGSTSTGGR
jgi:hypothetical protein